MSESKNADEVQVDWRFILTRYDEDKYTIPYFFDYMKTWTPSKTYTVRIANIYDISKFWVVFHYNELDIFRSFLSDYYKKHGHLYKIKAVRRGIYCVVFAEGAYYRGIVAEVSEEPKVLVFFMDFGYISAVEQPNIYYLAEKFYNVPRFAVRAVLHGIHPVDTCHWTMDAIKRFTELVAEKIMLCFVVGPLENFRTVYVHLADFNQSITSQRFQDVGDKLISEKLASVAVPSSMDNVKGKRLVPIVKYPYLFPSFDVLEKCTMPFTAYTMDMLRQCKSSSVLLKPYCMVNGVNAKSCQIPYHT
ncbi:unnamed protein product [Acanthoscelides obtectus]|uniref:Tudor domain-containing protein n=1 Tax=Acanthoscelides obtectus TaxID=200917 RepID=A0A9P0K0N3_ACAOB|nr:unnamed protein product [Acanthoscelides obtectus]CAK1654180.1 Tudor domain-containing protein 5 [Acanthoscelides obtectus]